MFMGRFLFLAATIGSPAFHVPGEAEKVPGDFGLEVGKMMPFHVADFVNAGKKGSCGCPSVMIANSGDRGIIIWSRNTDDSAFQLAKSLDSDAFGGDSFQRFLIFFDKVNPLLLEKAESLGRVAVGNARTGSKDELARRGIDPNTLLLVFLVEKKTIKSKWTFGAGELTDHKVKEIVTAAKDWAPVTEDPPSKLMDLTIQLKASGGAAEITQVNRNEWELTVDFPNMINDDALKPLHDLPGVTALRILNGGVTDKGLAHLKNLPDLRLLVIKSSQVSEEGMKAIGDLKGLTKLDLIQSRLSAKGLAELSHLKNLRELFLYGSEVSDKDIEPLKTMGHLEWINLPWSVSKERSTELQLALPTTRIVRAEK